MSKVSPKIIQLSWDDIDYYCKDVSEKISESEFHDPDMIISIGRGGMIPARILSDKLHLKNVHLFGIKLYKDIGEQMDHPVIDKFDVCVKDKEILLVDDLIDSGDTMETLVEEMSNRGARVITTVSLLKKDLDNSYDPDYYSIKFDKDQWIVFPWELHEFKVVEDETKVCLA